MSIIIAMLAFFLSFFGYNVTENSSTCEVQGVYISQRPQILYAYVIDNGQPQTYVWAIDTISFEAPVLQEVLPFEENLDFNDIAVFARLDIYQAIADDDEIIFVITTTRGEATRHDLSVCQRG